MKHEAARSKVTPAAADAASGPSDAELAQAEAELAGKETSLGAEVDRLQARASACGSKIQELRAQVTQAHQQGLRDPALAPVIERLRQHAPAFKAAGVRDAAFKARRQALEVRRRAAAQLGESLQAFGSEVDRMVAQLQTDEAEIRQMIARTRPLAQGQAPEAAEPASSPRPPAVAPVVAPNAKASPAQAPVTAPRPRAPAAKPAPKAVVALPVDKGAASRREAPRVRMQVAIDLSSDTNFFTGFSTNIGVGGIFVATVKVLPMGTETDVRFTLPSGETIDVHGAVRWTREVNDNTPDIFPGLGIQFTRLTPEAEKAIGRFVASREPMFFPD